MIAIGVESNQSARMRWLICVYSPVGTLRLDNVALTSIQRHDVASMLMRRFINVMWSLSLVACVEKLLFICWLNVKRVLNISSHQGLNAS